MQLQLTINGSVVSSVTLPEIANGTKCTINYLWNPSEAATYNITAYAPPVPDENITINNVRTKFISVHYPLINPVEGQYANYTINIYDEYGSIEGTMQWNFTYDHYVEPYIIYVTVDFKDQYGYVGSAWMTVNTMTRYVESGVWAGMWYPGWIETNIDVGSTLNLLIGLVKVNGSKILTIPPRIIDCWEISTFDGWYQYYYWYDKASGLWIRMEGVDIYGNRMELFLTDTNIPIGKRYEHDLGVSLSVPRQIQPKETSNIVANVYNLGLNNETDVQLQLLINSTLADSIEIPQLNNGTYYSLNYSWIPPSEGAYNITAYVLPVPNENVTANNVVSQIVHALYVKVAVISDYKELTVVAPILDSMQIGYDAYYSNSFKLYTENLTLLLKYETVIFYNTYRADNHTRIFYS